MIDGKKLSTIFNNDINNILCASSGKDITAKEYQHAVECLLKAKPGVLAQNVGMPDPVIYRTKVATTWDKYHTEVTKAIWPDVLEEQARVQSDAVRKLFDLGTDPLALTIDACRKHSVYIVASYRMNAEDFYHGELDLFDFGRAHKNWAIPKANCLDPAIPEVYQHRMDIFKEVANNYDIDGIEFDFMRWWNMVSDPLKNHHVLTNMVRDTREVLDKAAKQKGRKKMLLGVRVRPSLTETLTGSYPNPSCKDAGLDVRTWIEKGYVNYVCPSFFWPHWPGLPNTAEFVELAENTNVGIYPTVFPIPAWLGEEGPIEVDDTEKLMRYKNEFCEVALKSYDDGGDGISTYNWTPHHQPGMVKNPGREAWGLGAKKVQMYIHTILGDKKMLLKYGSSDLNVETRFAGE
ncbi:MAG: hypothetical protein H8D67_32220 [Deltaproteobacteria bacterium]|nr:hypothetical protein [Deltaproteobacteria bacterium]